MNRFAYEIYYEYSGRSHDSPFRVEKSKNDIDKALFAFPHDLRHFISDMDVQIGHGALKRTENSIGIFIMTTDTELQIQEAVKRCLNFFDLFGTKLEET